jgi:exoribonuclease R
LICLICFDACLQTYACLPKVPWSISPAEAATRADFSAWRIFSIDPITARDLDDALSIQPLGSGRWRLGVHIADVASFVRPGTALDEEAQIRGTSV